MAIVKVKVPFRIERKQVPAFLLTLREAAGDGADVFLEEVQVEGKDGDISGKEALEAYITNKWSKIEED